MPKLPTSKIATGANQRAPSHRAVRSFLATLPFLLGLALAQPCAADDLRHNVGFDHPWISR